MPWNQKRREFFPHFATFVTILTIFLSLLSSFILIFLAFWLQRSIISYISFFFFYVAIYKCFFTSQFCLSAWAIRARFNFLNKSLEQLLKTLKSKPGMTLETFVFMRSITKLSLDLCDLIELANLIFTPHLIFILLNNLVLITFCGFELKQSLVVPSEHSMHALIFQLGIIFSECFIVMILSYSGSSTTGEAEQVAKIVSRIISYSESNDLIKFLHQIKTRNLKLQNQFFVIGWNVALSVSFFSYQNCYILFLFFRQCQRLLRTWSFHVSLVFK